MKFKLSHTPAGGPLYKQAANCLQALICEGKLKPGEQLPSEIDLAVQLGISRLTLRKSLSLLSAQGLIRQHPRLGTFVAEKSSKCIKIGILCLDSEKDITFFYGYQLLLQFCLLSHLYPDVEILFLNCQQKTQQALTETFNKSSCDGYIVPYSSDFFSELLDQEKYDYLPIVYINKNGACSGTRHFNIALDDDPFKEAMEHLTACGHRRIAYICKELPFSHVDQRLKSFLKHAPGEAVVIYKKTPLTWIEFARSETVKLLSLSEPPTAIVTPGSAFTAGVMQALLESRRSMPGDISLLGFDHGGENYPLLSTVDQPLKEMAEKAVSLLREIIQGKVYRNNTVLFHSVFHDRGSIKNLTASQP